jgi:hypothetical protein
VSPGRIGLFAKHSLTKIFDSIIEMNKNKKGGRIRLIEIDRSIMPSVFANGNTKPSALSFAGQVAPKI